MVKFYLLLTNLILVYSHVVMSQNRNDTIRIPAVDISADRISCLTGILSGVRLDSLTILQYKGENLSALLMGHTTVSIKDYGAGGIATASVRGTAATHTAVTWNGFIINSPNLGLCDLSLIPATIADEITIYPGGSQTGNMHAALGGLISLAYKPVFERHAGISISGTYGDAGNFSPGLTLRFGNTTLNNQTRLFFARNNNRYLFINNAKKGFPEELLSHARVINYGFIHQMAFNLKKGQRLEAGVWYQVTGREQPPNMTSDINNAHLTDSILRVYTAYHLTRKRIMLTTKVAYFDESQRYDDPLYGIHANYKVRSYKAEVNGKFLVLPKLDAEAGASGNIAQAEISEYKHYITDVRYSVYGVLHWQPVKGLNIKGKIQQEITKGARPPLVPNLLITYSIWNNFLTLKASAGKQFNLPCLNDKYWVPGGNPNLMCETSWTGEAGYILSPDKKGNLRWSFTAYQILVDNWIQWAPIDSTGLYKAANLRKVCSRGFETTLNYKIRFNQLQVILSGCFAYTRCITKRSQAESGEVTEGKQLIYVPMFHGSAGTSLVFKGFTASYNHSFTDKRYTLSDNTKSLPAFDLASFCIAKEIKYRTFGIQLFLKVNNIWNEQYQQVKWHAMPLRNFTAGFVLDFNRQMKQATASLSN